MKIILTLMITLFSVTLYGQSPSPTPTAKQAKELAKKAEKAAKNEIKTRRKSMLVDLKEVEAFPQTFVGQNRYAESLSLGELKGFTVDGTTYYGVAVRTQQSTFWNFMSPDSVTFLADESQARRIFAYYQNQKDVYRDWYPAKIIFSTQSRVAGGRTYYIATFTCIEFIGFLSRTWETIGQCS